MPSSTRVHSCLRRPGKMHRTIWAGNQLGTVVPFKVLVLDFRSFPDTSTSIRRRCISSTIPVISAVVLILKNSTGVEEEHFFPANRTP